MSTHRAFRGKGHVSVPAQNSPTGERKTPRLLVICSRTADVAVVKPRNARFDLVHGSQQAPRNGGRVVARFEFGPSNRIASRVLQPQQAATDSVHAVQNHTAVAIARPTNLDVDVFPLSTRRRRCGLSQRRAPAASPYRAILGRTRAAPNWIQNISDLPQGLAGFSAAG